jgi:hypothetical protein
MATNLQAVTAGWLGPVRVVLAVLLGGGIPLLPPRSERTSLRLVSSKVYKTTGTLGLEYAVQSNPA